MSDPQPPPSVPKWLSRSVVTLLALQVGLLWVQGSLLQRQHRDLQALREDVQALADSLDQDQDQDSWDDSGIEANPARWTRHRGARVARVSDDEGDQAEKDLAQSRQSAQEALAKARDTQEKMSIQANIEKAEAKSRAEAAPWKPWLWGAVAVSVLSLLVRALFRRRG